MEFVFFSPKSFGAVKATGTCTIFLPDLPDPTMPKKFEAKVVQLSSFPGVSMQAGNEEDYNGSYGFSMILPEAANPVTTETYDIGLNIFDKTIAKAGLLILANDGVNYGYAGINGVVEATYSPLEKRLHGKFFFTTIGGKVFEGTFDVTG